MVKKIRPAHSEIRFRPVVVVASRINIFVRDALEQAANARAMTMSAWIREAIKEKLEREEAE